MVKNFTIDHKPYSLSELLSHGHQVHQDLSIPLWEKEVWSFIAEWFNEDDNVQLQTSGSTGTPKVISIEKKYLRNSANMTLEFLQLKRGDSALLCLSASYIAGKMMIVRALEGGLNLLLGEPLGNPLKNINYKLDFVAMVPLQVEKVIQEEGLEALQNIKQLIIGGAAVGEHLLRKLQSLNNNVWSTYGMTETVSHVAMKRLSGADVSDYFIPMPGVNLSNDDRGCLLINAPHLSAKPVTTNDVVAFNDDKHFRFVGRFDNIINSGGIKLVPELIEEKIALLFTERFIISSLPDERLGQKLVLYIESSDAELYSWELIQQEMARLLPVFERPKALFIIPQFEETKSGKVKRHS